MGSLTPKPLSELKGGKVRERFEVVRWAVTALLLGVGGLVRVTATHIIEIVQGGSRVWVVYWRLLGEIAFFETKCIQLGGVTLLNGNMSLRSLWCVAGTSTRRICC